MLGRIEDARIEDEAVDRPGRERSDDRIEEGLEVGVRALEAPILGVDREARVDGLDDVLRTDREHRIRREPPRVRHALEGAQGVAGGGRCVGCPATVSGRGAGALEATVLEGRRETRAIRGVAAGLALGVEAIDARLKFRIAGRHPGEVDDEGPDGDERSACRVQRLRVDGRRRAGRFGRRPICGEERDRQGESKEAGDEGDCEATVFHGGPPSVDGGQLESTSACRTNAGTRGR